MEKKPIVIIYYCFLLGLAIFILLWGALVLFPFLDYAQALSDIGLTYSGTVSEILELLFLNVYFIGTIVCGVVALVFKIIGWKALK
jgi:hypothetical protein